MKHEFLVKVTVEPPDGSTPTVQEVIASLRRLAGLPEGSSFIVPAPEPEVVVTIQDGHLGVEAANQHMTVWLVDFDLDAHLDDGTFASAAIAGKRAFIEMVPQSPHGQSLIDAAEVAWDRWSMTDEEDN